MPRALCTLVLSTLVACSPPARREGQVARSKRAVSAESPCGLPAVQREFGGAPRCGPDVPVEIGTDAAPGPDYENLRQCILDAARRQEPFVATWRLASDEPIVLVLAGVASGGGYVIHEVHHSARGARRFTCSSLADLRTVCDEPKPAAPLTSLDVMRLEGCPADPARSATYRLRLELGCADETAATDCP